MPFELSQIVLTWCGYAGVGFYLGSYALLQSGLIRGSGVTYTVMNMLAASLVLISLIAAFNLFSALIQIFWIVISLFGLARMAWLRMRTRFSPEDMTLIDGVLSHMPKPMARQFLNRGNWIDLAAGVSLTKEGDPVDVLYFLPDGQAEASSQGRVLGTVNGGLVGEINVMTKGPASADVIVTEPCRAFAISSDALSRLSARDSDFKILLENTFNKETGRKLIAANARSQELAT